MTNLDNSAYSRFSLISARNRAVRCGFHSAVVLILFLLLAEVAFAQASLVAEDTIDDLKVNSNGLSETFTVVRDAFNRDQWYYVPDTPRLYERTFNGKTEPEFSLIKYQFDDPQHQGTLLEGGLLQFAATLAIPVTDVEQLRKLIAARTHVGTDHIRLSAMPIKSAQVQLYTPQSGDLLSSAPGGGGLAPTFESQKMAFSMPLTAIGADVYSGLVNSNTGVPVRVEYSYYGTTPKAGFTVTVHWQQTFSHYSTDEDFRAEASYYGLVGASYHRSAQSIFEELRNSHCIDVDLTTGENFTMEQAQGYLQPILARINAELLEASKPPDKIDPAHAPQGGQSGYFGSVNYSVAMKSVTMKKSGDELFDFHVRSIVERKTVAGGFIGIGSYGQDVRDKLVFSAVGTFKRSFFVLPPVSSDDTLGIQSVTATVSLRGGTPTRELATKTASWGPQNGWKEGSQPASVLAFGLGGFQLSPDDMSKVLFVTDTTVNMRKGSALQYSQAMQAFNGSKPIARPENLIDIVNVDGTGLSWKRLDSSSKLETAEITISSGNRHFSDVLRPSDNNGKWELPKPLYWVVQNNDPINVAIKFRLDDGKTKAWSRNGDLRQQGMSPTIVLIDSDWKE